jgi:DNA-binding response OmpR family regulator
MVGKVLVVDDEDTLRLTIKTRLNAGGFETDAAVDGEEAIEKLKQTPFDVVLLDINMPRMDGITALEIISRQYPATDVIMLTGFADFSTAIDCLKKGAKDYLVKPIDTTELITRMRSLLRARNSEAALDSLRKSHAAFVFDRVIDPAVKLYDALILLKKGDLGKLTKDQSAVLSGMEEMAHTVVTAGVKSIDPAFLTPGGNAENRKDVSLGKVLDGVPEFASALAKTKEVEFVSNVKGKLPAIACEELRLREALRSVAAAAIGIAAKGATVALDAEKDSGEKITFRVTVSKSGEKGQKLSDQLGKPLDAIGGQLQKLDHGSMLLYAARRTFAEHGGLLQVNSANSEIIIECTVSKK